MRAGSTPASASWSCHLASFSWRPRTSQGVASDKSQHCHSYIASQHYQRKIWMTYCDVTVDEDFKFCSCWHAGSC